MKLNNLYARRIQNGAPASEGVGDMLRAQGLDPVVFPVGLTNPFGAAAVALGLDGEILVERKLPPPSRGSVLTRVEKIGTFTVHETDIL